MSESCVAAFFEALFMLLAMLGRAASKASLIYVRLQLLRAQRPGIWFNIWL
jgi:hypothetical protein